MELLTIGPIHEIANTTIRALPARATLLHAQFVSATTVNISNESNMDEPVALTTAAFTNGAVPIAAGFIQVVGGTARLRLGAQ